MPHSKAEHKKTELIKSLIEKTEDYHAQNNLKDKSLVDLARQFYHHTSATEIIHQPIETLFYAVLSMWKVAQKRTYEQIHVHVYNPDQVRDGWNCPHTVIEIIQKDSPFLVDSIMTALRENNLSVHSVVHPIMRIRRDDENGQLISVHAPNDPAPDLISESYIHLQVDRITSPQAIDDLNRDILNVLKEVRLSVTDWKSMIARLSETIGDLMNAPPSIDTAAVEEAIDFLRFMEEGNFTFLGYREYQFDISDDRLQFKITPKDGLGILRDVEYRLFDGIRHSDNLPQSVRDFALSTEPLVINKSNRMSHIHRHVQMDIIGIKQYNADGNVIGERVFTGLFTSNCYMESAAKIPYIRKKLWRVIALTGFNPEAHAGKRLRHILESFPRDELFQISIEELLETSLGLLSLHHRPRIEIFIRKDRFERFFSCMVYIPRDRMETKLRMKVQKILEQHLQGETAAFYLHTDENPLAQLRFIIYKPGFHLPDFDIDNIRNELRITARNWQDDLLLAMQEQFGEEEGRIQLDRLGNAFPVVYQEQVSPEEAVHDIRWIEECIMHQPLIVRLYQHNDDDNGICHFKIYHRGSSVSLSDVLPILRNMGLEVIKELPFKMTPALIDEPVWIHDFECRLAVKPYQNIALLKKKTEAAFRQIWSKAVADDELNRLVLSAGLDWREVTILRAYTHYLRQASFPFSRSYIERVLNTHHDLSQKLCALFKTMHAPDQNQEDARTKSGGLLVEIDHMLDAVQKLDEDRVLRAFADLIKNTLRTNFFQHNDDNSPKEYLTIKLDSSKISELPKPRPAKEIYIYSTRMEGVHLRGGHIARGGIRWSDRFEDFRTEILGLMKSQMVKNAVIIPVGAKGGFICKQMPDNPNRETFMNEGIACYKMLVRGMLEITDNIIDGKIIPPTNIQRWDNDDPYLVVAADKGTATFSDIANEVAKEYKFWLGDAFASGGSEGYDHKEMGITARGAWESVKRHFREIGKNIQEENFTCIGVGDMSGDVFGNGMLLSPHIKLIGAFNHLHIFCDPSPNPKKSFEERKRLFHLKRSSWADYNKDLLSKGGKIFDRSAKSLSLTPEIKEAFGIKTDKMTPAELIRAMLVAQTELLWFGGIGTYIKSLRESHEDVGDKNNDALRVNAKDLKAKIVGEGANLGVTQAARIEYAHKGGRINTDFIDNSAGVDTSDHEVNIKILLNDVMHQDGLSHKKRVALLESMKDEVASHVLQNNYDQTLALSLSAQTGQEFIDLHGQIIKDLEKQGRLDRQVEGLPDDETLQERKNKGEALTRPELSVLLAYSKISLYDALLESDIDQDSGMQRHLFEYFPEAIRKTYEPFIKQHKLRREIIATELANATLNKAGISFIKKLRDKTGADAKDIVRAFMTVREAFDLTSLWDSIGALDNHINSDIQLSMYQETRELLERTTKWFLLRHPMELSVKELADEYGSGIDIIIQNIEKIAPKSITRKIKQDTKAYTKHKSISKELGQRLALLPILGTACDIILNAKSYNGGDVKKAARIYYQLLERFDIEGLIHMINKMAGGNYWTDSAYEAVVEDLYEAIADLAAQIIQCIHDQDDSKNTCLDDWLESHQNFVDRIDALLDDIRKSDPPDFHMLVLISQKLRLLSEQ